MSGQVAESFFSDSFEIILDLVLFSCNYKKRQSSSIMLWYTHHLQWHYLFTSYAFLLYYMSATTPNDH